MKVYRYCSAWEYNKFLEGEKLVNTPEYAYSGECVFWFFPVEDMTTDDIKSNLHQLTGIVIPQVLMILDIDPKTLEKRRGRYAKRGAINYNPFADLEHRDEYVTPTYSKETATLLDAYDLDMGFYMSKQEKERCFKCLKTQSGFKKSEHVLNVTPSLRYTWVMTVDGGAD